jgi:olfactory receptor
VKILYAVFKFPNWEASLKALNTCGFHVCVILAFFLFSLFLISDSSNWPQYSHYIHTLLANLYMIIPHPQLSYTTE